MPTTFSIKECLSFGWRTFKARPWFFVGLGVVLLIVSFVSGFVQGLIKDALGQGIAGSTVSLLFTGTLNIFVSMGTVALYLKAHDNLMSASLRDLWHPRPFFVYLAASVCIILAFILGIVLLIVPGIIVSIMFMFTGMIIIDRGLGPIAALKESMRITKGHRWQLFRFSLAVLGIDLLGALALLVGLFVAIPVTVLATIHAYRTLSGQRPEPAAPPAVIPTA